VANVGVLTLSSGSISAVSSNVYQPSSLSTWVVDFGSTGGTLFVSQVAINGQNVAPLSAGFNVASGGGFRGNGTLTIGGGGSLS
jgi:hypothetical protein